MLIENQLKKLGFGTAAIFLLIVAVLLGAPQMYLMAIIIALVPVVSALMNRVQMRGISCRRRAPETGDVGGRMTVSVAIENTGSLPKFYLRATDALPRYLRYAGSSAGQPSYIGQLWPGETARMQYYIEPQRRGAHRIGPLHIQSSDLFGFTDLSTIVDVSDEILVYPEILPVSPALLSSGSAVGWRDEVDARSRGNGTDFTGVREYRTGDEVRRINWKTTARTGNLAVTEYTQGYASDLTIILDRQESAYAGSGGGIASAFEYAVKIATTLGASAMRQGSVVTLYSMASQNDRPLVMDGPVDLGPFLERLARVEADGDVDICAQLDRVGEFAATEASVVVISPRGADPPVRAALEGLKRFAAGAAVHAFWLDAPSFVDAPERIHRASASAAPSAWSTDAPMLTDLGTEYAIRGDTNLVALLGGSLG